MGNPISTEENNTPMVTRKQFLAIVGAAVGGFVLSHFFSSKQTYTADSSYGNNTYGKKS